MSYNIINIYKTTHYRNKYFVYLNKAEDGYTQDLRDAAKKTLEEINANPNYYNDYSRHIAVPSVIFSNKAQLIAEANLYNTVFIQTEAANYGKVLKGVKHQEVL